MENLSNFYRNKKIFITGHTGFKGTWLTNCLLSFGSMITGYSLNDSRKKIYESICNYKKVKNVYGDILDIKKLKKTLKSCKPQIIFHLAAQSLVSVSYKIPYKTIQTNTFGTLNLIESARKLKSLKALVIITSDKCYQNNEINKGYKETDRLGGEDPYSSSKAAAEIIYNSYLKSNLVNTKKIGFATARAGNVIGGGDWSANRVIPDCIESVINKKKLIVRSPNSTRPWQHVLEPILGYLLLGKKLYSQSEKYSSSWNFGPSSNQTLSVSRVINLFFDSIKIQKNILYRKGNFKESKFLKLNSNKAKKLLRWKNNWSMKKSIRETAIWYKNFLDGKDIKEFTFFQIKKYFKFF